MALFVAFFDTNLSFDTQQQNLQRTLEDQLTRFKQPNHYLPWPEMGDQQALKVPKQVFQTLLKNKGLISQSV